MESFPTERSRNDAAAKLIEGVKEEGQAAFEYNPAEWKAYVEFKRQTGATLEDLRFLWATHHQAVRPTMKVRDAVTKYMALRVAEGLPTKSDTFAHMRKALIDSLAAVHGEKPLALVTAEHLRELLAALKDRKGKGPASNTTKRNYRKFWATFFTRALREKWTYENPCKAVVPPRLSKSETEVLALADVFKFFQEARTSPIGARLAVEAFAGLRVSSSARLVESEIIREEGALVLPAHKHKLEERYFVEGFPKNLFAWLDLPGQRWDISESYYDKLKGDVFRAAKVKNPGNVLRHSFCTYHIALYRDASRTATLLTHRNPTMLYQHYRGKGVTQAQGRAYFQITPEAVSRSFEEFLALATTTHANQRPLRRDALAFEPTGRGEENSPREEADLGGAGSWQNAASEESSSFEAEGTTQTEDPAAIAEGHATSGHPQSRRN
jgi:hypothetical protein